MTNNSTIIICDFLKVEYILNVHFHSTIIAILIASIILGALFNTLFLTSMIKYTPKKSVSEKLFMALSIIDFIESITAVPAWVYVLIDAIQDRSLECQAMVYTILFASIFFHMSIVNIVLINVNLYLSVVHSYFYLIHFTRNNMFYLLAILWILCIITLAVPIIISKALFFTAVLIFGSFNLVAIVVTGCMYISIYLEFTKMQSRGEGNSAQNAEMLQSKKKLMKMTISISCVFLFFSAPLGSCSSYFLLVDRSAYVASYGLTVSFALSRLNHKVRTNIRKLFFARN